MISLSGACLVSGCDLPRKGRGYCNRHWIKNRKYGNPLTDKRAENFKEYWGGVLPEGTTPYKLPEYSIWCSMKSRCSNPKNPEYYNYGGRGIKVCDKWVGSFKEFILDMGLRPSPSLSLDRIDVDGNYEPSNCRWAGIHLQQHNKRLSQGNKTGYMGVFWIERLGKYVAYMTYKKGRKHIGLFETALEAAIARDKWATKLHGSDAKLNIRTIQ